MSVGDDIDRLAERLTSHKEWRWTQGMIVRRGGRRVGKMVDDRLIALDNGQTRCIEHGDIPDLYCHVVLGRLASVLPTRTLTEAVLKEWDHWMDMDVRSNQRGES